jgi:hypothetical protein
VKGAKQKLAASAKKTKNDFLNFIHKADQSINSLVTKSSATVQNNNHNQRPSDTLTSSDH